MARGIMKKIFVSGLLFWVPFLTTLWVVKIFAGLFDRLTEIHVIKDNLPHFLSHNTFFLKVFGVILGLSIILITGFLVKNMIGRLLISWWEKVMSRIPILNPIYNGVKQGMEVMIKPTSSSFSSVVLIEYPRKGLRSLAFITSHAFNPLGESGDFCSVFVPTTPNPTSGFILLMDRSEVTPVDMKVDEALKYIISLGTVNPVIEAKTTKTNKEKT